MPALLPAVAVETLFTTAAVAPTLAAAAPVVAPVVAAEVAAPLVAAEVATPAAANALGILPQATGILPETLGGAQGIMSGGAAAAPTATAATGEAVKPLSDAFHAQEAARTEAYRNASVAGDAAPVQPLPPGASAAPPPAPAQPLGITPQAPVEQFGVPPAEGAFTGPIKPTITSMERGGQSAFKLIGKMTDFAKENPITSLGGVMTAQKLGIFGGNDNGPKKDEYKRTPYDGLSPTFAATEEGTYKAPGGASPYLYGFADGGITGPVEQMSNMNAIGGNEMYPMANIPRLEYANPVQQRPISENIMTMGGDTPTDPYTGQLKFSEGGSTYDDDKEAAKVSAMRKRYSKMMGDNSNMEENISDMKSAVARAQSKSGIVGHGIDNLTQAAGPAAEKDLKKLKTKYKIKSYLPEMLTPEGGSMEYAASGGIMHGLGGYSDYASGGRLLKGPGDGVSDSIPAVIGSKQPARLADGEFVIPARIVSELGNGSTEAGARQLYAMMERIQKNRKKSVGKGKVAIDSKSKKHLPA